MLAFVLPCLIEDLVLKIELLSKHKILLKALIGVSSYEIVTKGLASYVASHLNLPLAVSNTFLQHCKEATTKL